MPKKSSASTSKSATVKAAAQPAPAPAAAAEKAPASPILLSKTSSIVAQVGFIDMNGTAHDKFESAVLTNAKALMMNRLSSYFKSRGMRMEAESIAQLVFGVDNVDEIKSLDDVIELRLILDETLAYHDRELELKPTHVEAN
jgi:hypothetical protein